MGIGLLKNSFDSWLDVEGSGSIKTRTALEAGSFGSRVLGMPRPVGTQDAESCMDRCLRMRMLEGAAGAA